MAQLPLGDKLTISVGGDTSIKANGILSKSAGGLLTQSSDGNDSYHSEILPDTMEAAVWLVADFDMVIDGRLVSAGTTSYKLYFLPRQKLFAVTYNHSPLLYLSSGHINCQELTDTLRCRLLPARRRTNPGNSTV